MSLGGILEKNCFRLKNDRSVFTDKKNKMSTVQ